jgi:hypothetical protein
MIWPIAVLLVTAPLNTLLHRFDNEHDPASKEQLLLALTRQAPGAGPALLRLAQSTPNADTRWMSMRGMVTLSYTGCVPFLEASLKNSDPLVRANAARALGDLRIGSATGPLLTTFAAEQDSGAIQQTSLALHMLQVKAAAPYIREKIPLYPGQTRAWLIQALGALGNASDVPLIARYLEDGSCESAPALAIAELTGVGFGFIHAGLGGCPTPVTVAARAWWQSHKDEWPRCDDCRFK